MKTVMCPVCNGAKNIMGLGMIEHTCTECKGAGWWQEGKEEKEEKAPVKIVRKKKKVLEVAAVENVKTEG